MENEDDLRFPQPIQITILFDEELTRITKEKESSMILSEGSTFVYLLHNIFMTYPEIEEKYPPGKLGFEINNVSPQINSPLFDGDVVSFSV